MAKRTKKVGIIGKYGVRYGCASRKRIKKIEISQHKKYECALCGKNTLKRTVVGIWDCRKCNKQFAGGAWTPTTTAAVSARNNIIRLRRIAQGSD